MTYLSIRWSIYLLDGLSFSQVFSFYVSIIWVIYLSIYTWIYPNQYFYLSFEFNLMLSKETFLFPFQVFFHFFIFFFFSFHLKYSSTSLYSSSLFIWSILPLLIFFFFSFQCKYSSTSILVSSSSSHYISSILPLRCLLLLLLLSFQAFFNSPNYFPSNLHNI